MDWITQQQNEEKAKKEAAEEAAAKEAAIDKAAQSWIGTLIESRLQQSVEQVNRRLRRDLHLTASDYGYGFRVFERRSGNTIPEYDWFEVCCYAQKPNEILLRGNKGWDPKARPLSYEGSPNDWHGEAWELKVRPRGPQLLGDEDIDALFKWLVAGTSKVPQLTLTSTGKKKLECFVATAVYGSTDAPELESLRFFRDELLLPSKLGRSLVERYYRVGLPLSQVLEKSETAKILTRILVVAPIVGIVRFVNVFLVRSRHG
jgi:hypothetical protein